MSDLSLVERCSVRNVVCSEWRPHLAADERDLVSYILELTVAWGREALEFTFEQLEAGQPAPENSGYTWRVAPINVSRASFYRTLKKLKDRGIVFVEAMHRAFTRIWINLDWRPEEAVMTPRLAISKHRARKIDLGEAAEHDTDFTGAPLGSQAETQAMADDRILGSQSETPSVSIWDTIERDVPKKDVTTSSAPQSGAGGVHLPLGKRRRERVEVPPENTPPPPVAPPPLPRPASTTLPVPSIPSRRHIQTESPAEIVERVMSQTRANLSDRADKARNLDTVEAYAATFANAWVETFAGTPPAMPSQKELYMLRSTLRARFKDNAPLRHAFVEFVVRNWQYLMSSEFGWMTFRKPPELPDIAFICGAKFIGRFLDAFSVKERTEYIKLLPAEERELERMVDAGKTREEALVAIGERRALSKVQGEDRENRRALGESLRRAEEARRQREEAAKAELARRAEERRQAASKPAVQPANEYDDLLEGVGNLKPIEIIELPPFDPSAFD